MIQRQWWERPRLQGDGDGPRERRVDWLELFFDLVFVVVIAELAHYLAGHMSLAGAAGYVLLFLAAWWVWIGGVFYNERFETYDISFRLFIVGLMIPTAAMAFFVHDALGATGPGFALSYAAARALVTFMWLRAGVYVPRFRPVAWRYTIGFSVSIALFVLSVFVPPPARFVLWAIGLTFDLVTPITTLPIQRNLPRFSTSKLPERFGLFVIIVLGEGVAGVVRGVAAAEQLAPATGLSAVLSLLLAFGLWWVYFDYVGRWKPRPGVWWSFAWNYLHVPLVMAITAIGAGVLLFIAPEDAAATNVRWAIAGGTAVALAAIGLIELTLQPDPLLQVNRRLSAALKLGAAGGAALVAALGSPRAPMGLLPALLGLLAIQIVYGSFVWYRRSPAGSPDVPLDPDEIATEPA